MCVLLLCSHHVPNRTSLYPISFARLCPLANIGTYVFFASIIGNLKSKNMFKKIFSHQKKCGEQKVQVENNIIIIIIIKYILHLMRA
jgi:hypothetical protein